MALMAPVVLGAAGLSMDYTFMIMKQTQLQDAADAAALAAAQELTVSIQGTSHIESIVKSYVASVFGETPNLAIVGKVEGNNDVVSVNLSLKWSPFFAQYLGSNITPLVVNAKAGLAGIGKTCVLGLMPHTLAGVHLDNESRLNAADCGVYSNSTSIGSLRADGQAKAIASTFCATGGYMEFGVANLSPKPVTDCPVMPDPLIARTKPTVGACTYNSYEVKSNATLSPGTYCGGLKISNNASVVMKPGIYVIKDGPLLVENEATLKAEGVGFFLTGPDSLFKFTSGTHISLKAPVDGVMAGLLFYEDQDVPYSFKFNPFFLRRLPADVRLHNIASNDAKQLLGTIYLPRSILLVDAEAQVASESAYTAIVVGRLWLKKGPTLVLNANYSVTDVPVPAGLAGQQSRLIQ